MEPENRMVSAEWLKSKCYEICDEYNTEHLYIDRIIDEIDNAPDAEVVRCEECKYRVLDTVNGEDWCNHTLGLCGEVYATDFCCHGERKDND